MKRKTIIVKRLNFFPYYEELLLKRVKTTTFRLIRPSLDEGERVMLSIGWEENSAIELHTALIRKIYPRLIGELNELDFDGESPDCKSVEATRLVLGCIYKTKLTLEDQIWVVKFDHN